MLISADEPVAPHPQPRWLVSLREEGESDGSHTLRYMIENKEKARAIVESLQLQPDQKGKSALQQMQRR